MEKVTQARTGCKLLAVIVITSLLVALFPTYLYAIEGTSDSSGSAEGPIKTEQPEASLESVTESDVLEKTEDTTTYDLGAGEKMTVFHGGQVRYEDEQGKLVDYDRSLAKLSKGDVTTSGEALSGYSYTNKEGDKKQYLPKTISEETPILMESEDHQITLTPSEGTLKDTGLQGATVSVKKKETPTLYETEETLPVVAEYQNKKASASFSYESGESGIKETLTLNEKPAGNVFTYVLTLKGMIPKSNPTDNGITFFDEESGDIVADISPAWMNDSSEEAYSDDITYEIQELAQDGEHSEKGESAENAQVNGDSEPGTFQPSEGTEVSASSTEATRTFLLTMTIDAAYLEDENRKYPVTVDPTVTWKGKSEVTDVYVISGSYAKTNFYSSGTKVMPAGKNSTGTHQTYVLFENLKKTIKGQSISSAKMTAYEVGDGEKNQKVAAYRVTKKWKASKLTWNNKPSNNGTVLSSIKTKNKRYTAQVFDLKSFVSGLAKDSYENYGIVLKNTTSNRDYAAFYGSRYGTAAYRPKLVVTYYSKPTTATSASISPRYVDDSKEAKLTFSGISSSGLDHAEYKVVAYDDSTASEGDVKLNYSTSRPIKSGGALPELSEGCYKVYVRGVNKAGTAGSGKSAGILHVDKTSPVFGTVTLPESSEENPGQTSPVLTWKDIKDSHLKEISVSVDGGSFKKAGTTALGQYTIPREQFDQTGRHTITVKATDSMGNSSEKVIEDYYVSLDGPEVKSLKLRDTEGAYLGAEDWTRDGNPSIVFTGLSDEHSNISQEGIRCALVQQGDIPAEDDFKEPENLVLKQDGDVNTFKGSFSLREEDQNPSSGSYQIYVRFTNDLGNYTEKDLTFNFDQEKPKGEITIASPSGVSLEGAVSDTIIVTGKISDRQNDEASSFSGIKESSITLHQVEEDGKEKQKGILYRDVSESTSRPLDTTKYGNGKYILKLTVEDNAGNQRIVTKPIQIANPLAKPDVTTERAGNETLKLTWNFGNAADISKVEYRIRQNNVSDTDDSGAWTVIAKSEAEESTTLSSGSAYIQEPSEEGIYIIEVRGKDSSGLEGNIATATYVVDRTNPIAELSAFKQGKVLGTATDANLKKWSIAIKEKSATEEDYREILTGTKGVKESFGFLDLSSSEYIEGETYLLRLTAVDQSGNTSDVTLSITKDKSENVAKQIAPEFRIERPSGQSYDISNFQIGTLTKELTLKETDNSSPDNDTVCWYVNGRLKAEGSVYEDDFSAKDDSEYTEGKDYDILAVSTDSNGDVRYSRTVTVNGEKQIVSMKEKQTEGSSAQTGATEQEVFFSQKAVTFRIDGPDTLNEKEVTYEVKLKNGEYQSITPGEKVRVSSLAEDAIYTEAITLRIHSEDNLEDLGEIAVMADTLSEESFSISTAENYRPVSFSVRQKLNYKTYFTWNTESEGVLPDDVSYEVYRSTEEGFTPSKETLVASDFASQSYTEINTGYSGKYYYRVRAVQKDDDDNVISASGYSKQTYGKVVDGEEYLKRLGTKEYWSYATMSIPQGTASIEKSQGNFTYSTTDAQIPNEGVDVSFDRTYNSMSTTMSSLGLGWSSSFDMEVLQLTDETGENEENLVLRYGDGTIYLFTKTKEANHSGALSAGDENGTRATSSEEGIADTNGLTGNEQDDGNTSDDSEFDEDEPEAEYISSLGKYVTLRKTHTEEEVTLPKKGIGISTSENQEILTVASDYTVCDKDGNEYRFNSFGKLVYLTESNGNFAILEYGETNGLLNRIRTNRNLCMEISYNAGEDGTDPLTIREVKLPDGSRFEYEYKGNPEKENVRLTSVTHYGSDGKTLQYRYDYDSSSEPKLSIIYDGNENPYSITYDKSNRAMKMRSPEGTTQKLIYAEEGEKTTTQTIIPKGLLSTSVLSEEKDFFDSWFGNCLEHVDSDGNHTTYTYQDNLLVRTESEGQYEGVDAEKNVLLKDKTDVTTTSYDAETENVTKEREEDGSITNYSYDGDNVTEERGYNADGTLTEDTEYEYDESDNEVYSHDEITGDETLTEYYEEDSKTGLQGEVKKEVSKEEGTTVRTTSYTYEYNEDGTKTETEKEVCDGITTKTVTVTDAMGREVESSVSIDGKLKSKTVNTYDGFGRLVETAVTQGKITKTTESRYDDNGNILSEKNEEGITTTYTYNKENRVTAQSTQAGELRQETTTEYGHEDITLKVGSVIKKIENAAVVTEKNMEGRVTSKTYTAPNGTAVRQISEGIMTDQFYDKSGNGYVSYEYGEASDEEGGILTLSLHDKQGQKTHAAVNPEEVTADSEKSNLNPELQSGAYRLTGDCIVTETEYDANGNTVKTVDGEGNATGFRYDEEGQLVQVKESNGSKIHYSYEKGLEDGKTKTITTDANGNKSAAVTNARGLEESITDYLDENTIGIQRTLEYDEEGNVIRETELEGNQKVCEYDEQGFNTRITYENASGKETLKSEFTYDEDGQLLLMEDYEKKDGEWNLYRSTAYTYDKLNRMSSYTEWNGEAKKPENPTASYIYDTDGDVTEILYENTGSNLKSLTFEYDGYKRLSKIKADMGGVLKKTVREYSYDNLGNVSSMKDSCGAGMAGSTIVRTYGYDQFERVISMTYTNESSGAALESFAYTYDKNSNLLSESRMDNFSSGTREGANADTTRKYSYDSVGRLTKVKETDNLTGTTNNTLYTYDKAGNRLSKTTEKEGIAEQETTIYDYNGLNQLMESTTTEDGNSLTTSYAYDKNGNQISEILKQGDDVTMKNSCEYDEANRLKKFQKKVNGENVLTQENRYNGTGQRIEKSESGYELATELNQEETESSNPTGFEQTKTETHRSSDSLQKEGKTTQYFYQDGAVLYTTDGTGESTSMYLLGESGNVIMTSRTTDENESWYLYNKDIRESTTGILDEAGNAVVTYSYDEFGNTTANDIQQSPEDGKTFDNEICYTGQIYDQSSGLYYYNARYYDSGNGRFTSQDTYRGEITEPSTLHLYAYCGNDPINYTDKTGNRKKKRKKNETLGWGVTIQASVGQLITSYSVGLDVMWLNGNVDTRYKGKETHAYWHIDAAIDADLKDEFKKVLKKKKSKIYSKSGLKKIRKYLKKKANFSGSVSAVFFKAYAKKDTVNSYKDFEGPFKNLTFSLANGTVSAGWNDKYKTAGGGITTSKIGGSRGESNYYFQSTLTEAFRGTYSKDKVKKKVKR